MTAYIIRRLLSMIPVLIIVSIIAFSLLYILPGDPALAILGELDDIDESVYLAMRAEMGLDDPMLVQYFRWAGKFVTGDFGKSILNKQEISQVLAKRIPVSFSLGVAGMIVSLLIGLPLALLSALKPGGFTDTVVTGIAVSGVALPGFFLAILLMYVFAVLLKWVPPSGYVSFFENPFMSMKLMILPALSLGFRSSAVIMRQGRASLINVLKQDYIVTARSKGLREKLVINRHAVKNALIPVVTVIGIMVGRMVSGAIITETIFGIPGLGRLAVDAVFSRDYNVLQAAIMVLTLFAMFGNLLADLAYAYLDPRIRYE